MTPSLTLIIPGLRGVVDLPDARRAAAEHGDLARWLGRGERVRGLPSGYERLLLALADYPLDPARDAPVAAFARLGEGAAPTPGWWLRADPIHLHADRDQLLVLPPAVLDLSEAEARSLTQECSRFFAEDGWTLEALHPRRWYLGLPQDPGLRTYDLEEVTGKALADFLPRGPQSRRWQTLLTELQMMLHAAAANRARASQRRLPVNGVWLWGSGTLSPSKPIPWARMWAREPFAVGLARHSGVACAEPLDAGPVIAAARAAPVVVVLDGVSEAWASGHVAAYSDALSLVWSGWVAPIYEAVRRKQIVSALLATDAGLAFRLDGAGARRFWRRGRRLSQCFAGLALGE